MKNSLRRGIRNEKEKMEQSFAVVSGNGDSYITFVRLLRFVEKRFRKYGGRLEKISAYYNSKMV